VSSDEGQLWRGTSSDERADDRRLRLIAACQDIVGREGSSGLVVRSICGAAKVSPRKFYESFPDTDSLLIATYECALQELLEAITAAAVQPGAPAKKPQRVRLRLQAVFDAATRHLEEHPAAGRIIFREAFNNDALRVRAMVSPPAFLQPIRRMVIDRAGEPPDRSHGTLESALMAGGLSAVFIEWLSGSTKLSRDEVVAYCTEATLSILLMKLPAS
jgi:AcrR family transcriptional regulator